MNSEMRIIKELKPGGQKKVFLVEHEKQQKIYKIGKCNTSNGLKRIIREVNILREIDSEYFPKNYFFSYDERNGTFEILEEYIEGDTLNNCMENYKEENEIAQLIFDVVDGMRLLWKKEIVHRDLKPDNIIISNKTLKPVIIDLGIARSLLEESLTKTILPIGPCTIPYASPEQLLNQKNLISPRSDFFSLAIIAMELYYDNNPFEPNWVGSGLGIRDNIVNGNKRLDIKNTSKSKDFIKIFEKALQTEPFNRYRKYTSFKEELEKFLSGGVYNE